ncbi:hypothetical protein F5Y11DRAFT_14495 [Daldinia sp. FL1419]|nr:hypothetical protein F5Y11DRAFT_14495 [Daldinia sp. FL1419]
MSSALTSWNSLLAPLGRYRSEYIELSKGKRDKKRKRKSPATNSQAIPPPPAPELKFYVDVGLATVTRHLQESASQTRIVETNPDNETPTQNTFHSFYSAIFVARSGQSNAINGHLPQMVAVASKAHPEQTPIRLVGLSKPCEDRLSESLGIPRVSCIGIRKGAPGSKALVEFVSKHVPEVEIQWIGEARKAEYKATNINTIETFVGVKKQHNHGPIG